MENDGGMGEFRDQYARAREKQEGVCTDNLLYISILTRFGGHFIVTKVKVFTMTKKQVGGYLAESPSNLVGRSENAEGLGPVVSRYGSVV